MRIDSTAGRQRRYRYAPGRVREFSALIYELAPISPLNIMVGRNSSGMSTVLQALQTVLLAGSIADDLDARKAHRAFQEIVAAPGRLRWSAGAPAWLSTDAEAPPHDHSDREATPSIRSGLISGGYEFARYDNGDYSSEQLASLEAAWRAVAALALLYLASLLGVQPIPAGRMPVHRANAPCGVARLAATTVPRAPGVGFATSPPPTPCPA